MSTEVTLELPDELWERVRNWADRSGRPLNQVFSSRPWNSPCRHWAKPPNPVSDWSDQEVLSTADLQLSLEIRPSFE